MPLNFKILAFLSAITFFAIFISLVKRKSIKPFYAFLWFTISMIFLSVVVFEQLYKRLADFLQLTDASFFIIVGVIFFLMVYVLHLSLRISEMADRIQELISYTAILENRIRKIDATFDRGPSEPVKDERSG
ncbi:DUF2304 domain-containing protein [candidate division KSB1 bacterium]|nr:DUF2304 domain-containing protein [candidate division KSB1 bacterium]